MTQPVQNNAIYNAVEPLRDNVFDGLTEAVTVLLNTAMVAEKCFKFWANRDFSRWYNRAWRKLAASRFRHLTLWLDDRYHNRGRNKSGFIVFFCCFRQCFLIF